MRITQLNLYAQTIIKNAISDKFRGKRVFLGSDFDQELHIPPLTLPPYPTHSLPPTKAVPTDPKRFTGVGGFTLPLISST